MLRFSLYFSARDEAADAPNWGRELSVIDMLKGSDGHVYKGRFRQVCWNFWKKLQTSKESTILRHPLSWQQKFNGYAHTIWEVMWGVRTVCYVGIGFRAE